MSELAKLDICEGAAGLSVYLNDERIAGVRDNGLMHTIHSWNVRASDVLTILRPTPPGAPEAVSVDGEGLARKFHDTYERLAPSFGYETRPETREFDPSTPNGKLMIAVCAALSTPANIPADGEVERVALAMIASIEDRDFYDPSPDEWRIAARAAIAALRTKADVGDGR